MLHLGGTRSPLDAVRATIVAERPAVYLAAEGRRLLSGWSIRIPDPAFARRRQVAVGDSRLVRVTPITAVAVSIALPAVPVVVLARRIAVSAAFPAFVLPVVSLDGERD